MVTAIVLAKVRRDRINETAQKLLKIMQEIITMVVFGFFCVFYMRQKITLDFLWAGLCLVGAAYFLFRRVA